MAVDNIARGMAASALKNQGGGGSSLPIVNTATVGQTIRVSAVDENGQPTEWEAVDCVDETLTVSGKAADAKVVGDAISSLSEEIANLQSGGSGLTSSEKTAMLALFKAAAYTSDVSATITQLETLWSGSGGGEIETTYSITNNLTNVTNSNAATSVYAGVSYTANLTVADGNVLNSIVITMGGVDITSDAYAEGYILITNVTGDIVITAVAGKTILYQLADTPKSVSGLSEDTGIMFGSSDANGYVKALSICIAYTGFDENEYLLKMSSNGAIKFNSNAAGTKIITCCNNGLDVSPGLSETGDWRIVITKEAKSEKTIKIHTLNSGEVTVVSNTGSYGNFAHSAQAGNLLVGSSDILVNNLTIYEGVLSSADIAAFLNGGDI